jgi:hypothetical protein
MAYQSADPNVHHHRHRRLNLCQRMRAFFCGSTPIEKRLDLSTQQKARDYFVNKPSAYFHPSSPPAAYQPPSAALMAAAIDMPPGAASALDFARAPRHARFAEDERIMEEGGVSGIIQGDPDHEEKCLCMKCIEIRQDHFARDINNLRKLLEGKYEGERVDGCPPGCFCKYCLFSHVEKNQPQTCLHNCIRSWRQRIDNTPFLSGTEKVTRIMGVPLGGASSFTGTSISIQRVIGKVGVAGTTALGGVGWVLNMVFRSLTIAGCCDTCLSRRKKKVSLIREDRKIPSQAERDYTKELAKLDAQIMDPVRSMTYFDCIFYWFAVPIAAAGSGMLAFLFGEAMNELYALELDPIILACIAAISNTLISILSAGSAVVSRNLLKLEHDRRFQYWLSNKSECAANIAVVFRALYYVMFFFSILIVYTLPGVTRILRWTQMADEIGVNIGLYLLLGGVAPVTAFIFLTAFFKHFKEIQNMSSKTWCQCLPDLIVGFFFAMFAASSGIGNGIGTIEGVGKAYWPPVTGTNGTLIWPPHQPGNSSFLEEIFTSEKWPGFLIGVLFGLATSSSGYMAGVTVLQGVRGAGSSSIALVKGIVRSARRNVDEERLLEPLNSPGSHAVEDPSDDSHWHVDTDSDSSSEDET